MNMHKSPWIMIAALALLIGGIFASRGMGGKVGTADELNKQLEADAQANAAAHPAVPGSATGIERKSNADAISESIIAKVKTTDVKKRPMIGDPRKQGTSLIRLQKPANITAITPNKSAPYGQWYTKESGMEKNKGK